MGMFDRGASQVTVGNAGQRQAAPRGTARYDPNTGYTGAQFADPNTWASDSDYNAYMQSQAQPKVGPSSSYIDQQGVQHPYASNPASMTALYQTTGGENPATAVSGQGSLTTPSYEHQQQSQLDALLGSQDLEHRAKLNDAAFDKRTAAITKVGGEGGAAHVNYGGAEADAARAAAFARAKDMAGANARASLDALHNVVSERGVAGGGYEAAGTGAIIGGARGSLDDFGREQLLQDLNQQEHVNDARYSGDITQRGQDLSKIASLQSLLASTGRLY